MALASGQLGAAQANQQAGKDQVMSGFGQLAGVGIQAMESGVFDGVKLPKWLGGNDEEKQVDKVVVKKP